MVLYVVRVPDPPAGADWSAAVPGQYIYDITGITATLTPSAGVGGAAIDSSGNGLNGLYTGHAAVFVPGLIPGDLALQVGNNAFGNQTGVSCPPPGVDFLHSWSIAWWLSRPVGVAGIADTMFSERAAGSGQWHIFTEAAGAGYDLWFVPTGAGATEWISVDAAFPDDGLPHFFVLTFNGAVATLYIDNVVVPWAVTGTKPFAPLVMTDFYIAREPAGGGFCTGVMDEVATFNTALSAGNVTTLWNARGTFAGYTTAVLGLAPRSYYHLDAVAVGPGRQVMLAVTDGTNTVEQIPSGFVEVTTPGPFNYSWQPKLQSSTQSPNGITTTVAIPRLLIPAGYTVGARTLDLAALDRWSAVTLWWDSAYMDSIGPDAYDFPPGARLRYKQIVN